MRSSFVDIVENIWEISRDSLDRVDDDVDVEEFFSFIEFKSSLAGSVDRVRLFELEIRSLIDVSVRSSVERVFIETCWCFVENSFCSKTGSPLVMV